jgi:serine/threonine protein kinase
MFEHQGVPYLVQEFIEGTTYADYLQGQESPLPIRELEKIFQETLIGLRELHRHNIIHRDIKPSNLMRRSYDSSTVLIDFGSACDLSANLQGQGQAGVEHQTGRTRMYTPGYAHPDQRDDLAPATPQWDLYGLAKTVMALGLGSEPPWSPPPSIAALGFSPPIQTVLREMLKPEGCCFSTAADVLQALNSHQTQPSTSVTSLASGPVQTPRGGFSRPSLPRVRGRPIRRRYLGISIGAIAGLFGGLYLWLTDSVVKGNSTAGSHCPHYITQPTTDYPIPDRGVSARFYYPKTATPGDSVLEVWHDDRLVAQAQDHPIPGFIAISTLSQAVPFPSGTYHLRLIVPESVVYEETIELSSEFPSYYLGQTKPQMLICAVFGHSFETLNSDAVVSDAVVLGAILES